MSRTESKDPLSLSVSECVIMHDLEAVGVE